MTFQSGSSGNPNGRPKGTGTRQQLFNALVDPKKNELVTKAIEMALGGSEGIMKVFLERILPPRPTSEPINFELPKDDLTFTNIDADCNKLFITRQKIFEAVASGEITPDEGAHLNAMAQSYHRDLALYQINDVVRVLQEMKKGGVGF